MSEYMCRNGHMMRPSGGIRCHICGSKVYYEDGMTHRQIKAQEEYDDEEDIRYRKINEDREDR